VQGIEFNLSSILLVEQEHYKISSSIPCPHPPFSASDGSPLARYVDIHAEEIDEDDRDFLSSKFMPLFTPIKNLQL